MSDQPTATDATPEPAGVPEPVAAPALEAVPDLTGLVDGSRIVICCGSGGVGKTTTAAVIALEGARRGRRAVVVTIDPAKRLADALGLSALTNTPTKIDGPWPGELWAVMLDTKSTFDALVVGNAPTPEQADRILANPFYRNISQALSGTQEYMATEKLYELHEGGAFDLVVVDTPPTRNALDFLDAPARLTRFLDHRLYRVLMTPTRAYMRAMNAAAQAFLRPFARVVGMEVVQDAITFFQAFDGMEAGFRDRASRVLQLLTAPGTAYVVVASPRRDTVDEASFFADKLAESGVAISALIVNRMQPSFGGPPPAEARSRAEVLAGTALGDHYANLADVSTLAANEEAELADLKGRIGGATVVRVPLLRSDVHDLEGLDLVAAHLFARPAPR